MARLAVPSKAYVSMFFAYSARSSSTRAAAGALALPFIESFEVEIAHEPPGSVVWNGKLADIDTVFAKTATLAARDSYAAAFAAYPAWKGACLIVGVAVPSRDEEMRAREVRDRFVKDVLPHVAVTAAEEPRERY